MKIKSNLKISICAIVFASTCQVLAEYINSTRSSGTGNWVNFTSGTEITSIVEDGDYLWVGSYGGLTRLNKTNGEMTHYNSVNSGLPDNMISSIARDVNDSLWIGADNGLAKFDGTNWTVELLPFVWRNESLPIQPMDWSIVIDLHGNKWIGTNRPSKGLAQFDGRRWMVFKTDNSGLPSNSIHCLAIDENGNKWIGTDKGLTKFDGRT